MGDNSKIVEMIDEIRSQLPGLTSPMMFGLEVFKGPTQVAVFVFRMPDISVLIFRSNPTLPDKEVRFLCDIPLRDAPDELPIAWKNESQERIKEFASSDETISLDELYEKSFLMFFDELDRRVVEQKAEFTMHGSGAYMTFISWCRPGEISVGAVIADLVALDQKQFPNRQFFAHSDQDRVAYFGRLPSDVVIGVKPERTFREKLADSWSDEDEGRMTG
ncbi:MAG TPA: hypothetical protein VGL00_07670, partial [Terracidiphilus sp.]